MNGDICRWIETKAFSMARTKTTKTTRINIVFIDQDEYSFCIQEGKNLIVLRGRTSRLSGKLLSKRDPQKKYPHNAKMRDNINELIYHSFLNFI